MTAKKSSAPAEPAREIVVSRLIDAPRERVWEAWADPEQVAKWWGPHGFTTKTKEREFKPGGVWRHTMIGPDGTEYPNLARFEEVVRPERIVYTNGGGRPGDAGVHFRSTVTFVDRGGKTELTLRLVFDTPEQRDHAAKDYGAIEGGHQTLSRLASHVAGEFVLSRLVNARRERVWKAWTEAERLTAWFGPKGFETFHSRLDLRPGGVYHYGLRGPGGVEIWGKWTFREIAALERLVFVNAFSDKNGGEGRHPLAPSWPAQMLSTILFQDLGGRTLVTVKWAPLDATEAERKTFDEGHASMRQGWTGTFERLDADLAKTAISTDRIERKILLRAPRSRVWRALTDPGEFGSWFGVKVDGRFAPGARVRGAITHEGYEHVPWDITIERMDPERLFSWRWHPYAVEPGVDYSAEPTTLVVFELEEVAGGTLLTLVESGFDRIPLARRAQAYRMNGEGWTFQMQAIERHLGTAG